MLKNKTFKSLAAATVLAFGATSLAGAPAQAATTYKLQSAVGATTNFSTLNDYWDNRAVNDDLGDNSGVDGDADEAGTYDISAALSLKVFVNSVSEADPFLNLKGKEGQKFAYIVNDAASGSATDIETAVGENIADLGDNDLDNTSIVTLDSDDVADIELVADTGWQVVTVWALNTADSSTIKSIKGVTATVYGEADAIAGMTAGDDIVGPNASLNYYIPKDVTITAAFDGLTFGDDSVAATFTTSPALNHEQLLWGADAGVDAWVTSRTFDAAGDNVAYLSLDTNADDEVVLSGDVLTNWNGADDVILEATYKLQATIYSDADSDNDQNSAVKYAKITEPAADLLTVDVTSKGNVYTDGDYVVRSGVKAVTIEGDVTDNAGDAVKSAVVTVTLQTTDMDDDETIKAGGKTYTVGTSDAIEVEVTTDADGKYSLPVTTSTAADGDSFDFSVETPGDINPDDVYTEDTIVWEDAYVDEWYVTPGDVVGVTASGTATLNFLVVDQFGEPISKDGSDALKVYVEDSGDTEEEISQGATISNGKASIAVKNKEVAGASYDLNVYVYAEGNSRTTDDYDSNSDTVTVYVWEAASATVALEEDGEYLDGVVTYEDYVTGTDVPSGIVDYSDIVNDGEVTIDGFVEDANGNVQPGAPVTITGKGYLFADVDDVVWSQDSITVYADENGEFIADVYSHLVANKAKITVTSGSGSENALVSFEVPGSVDPADVTWTVSGPSYAQSGKTAVVVATLADKWGNGLPDQDVEIVLDGIGLLNGDDVLSRTTNSHGQVKAYLSVQAGDTGVSDLTFTLDDGDSEYFDVSDAEDDEILNPVLVKTTHYGSTYAKASAKGNVNVSFGYAAGKRVKIYVDGVLKLNVLKKSDAPVKKSYAAAAGSHKVVVKVDGVVIKSKTVTAK